MKKRFLTRLLLPLLPLSITSPVTSLTSCGLSELNFKFNNDVVYLPINTVESLTNFMTIDSSILPREILWSSSNTDIIKISTKGEVLGVRTTPSGESVVLSATLYGNTVSCRAVVGEFSFNTNMIVLRESSNTANVYESYFRSNTSNISNYTSLTVADTNVATVDSAGNIIPKAEGLTTISATSRGGTVITTGLCIERDILDDFTLTETSDSSTYIISNYTGEDTEVVLPRYKNGRAISYLGECFNGNSTLTKVTVPDTYTKIVSDVFIIGCDNVTSFILPDTIEDIKDYIYYNCAGIDAIASSETNVKRGFKYLKSSYPEGQAKEKYSYLVGVHLDSITIDESIPATTTKRGILTVDADCKVLTQRCLSYEALGDDFSRLEQTVAHLSYPSTSILTCISDDVFTGNTCFLNLRFPNTVKYIHDSFRNLGEIIGFNIPESLEYIGTDWLEGSTILDSLSCFKTVGDLVYLGNDKNNYQILYSLRANTGGVASTGNGNFEVTLEPTCKIIGSNAFQINYTDAASSQGYLNALSRINKSSNAVDTTNRLFSGTVSTEDTSIVCVSGNAFANCRFINNIVLSSFVKYFDIDGISSSGIRRIFCESSAQPAGFDTSADTTTASQTLFFQSAVNKQGNYWHYNNNWIATTWADDELAS